MENGTDPLLQWLTNAGSLGILASAVIAFLRGWIVPGSVANQLRAERDQALDFVRKQADITQRALEAAEQSRNRRTE